MQDEISVLHIYISIPKAIFHSHLNLNSENPRQSRVKGLSAYLFGESGEKVPSPQEI